MIYFIILTYLIVLSISFDFLKVKGPKNFFYYFTLIVFILIAGLRWKVGGDTLTYQARFETMIHPITEISRINFLKIGWEPGYVIINSICKSIVKEFWFFQLVLALFVNVIMFDFFKKYTPYVFTAIVFYAIFYYFYFNMEILREIIPICIFIKWMYPLLEKRNYKKYYLLNIVCLFFHTSSIILFFIPYLSKFELNKKSILKLGIIAIILPSIFKFFPGILNLISFSDRISSKFDTYANYDLSIIGMLYLLTVFGIFPYYLYKVNKKYYETVNFNKIIFPYFFIVIIYVSYSGFGRFINYFGPFMIIFFVNTIYLLYNHNKFKNVKLILILMLIIFPLIYKIQYYQTSYEYIKSGANKFDMYYPYSSILDKENFYEDRVMIYTQSMNEVFNNSKKREN